MYLWELTDIMQYVKEPGSLILDDLEYAKTSGKILPFLSNLNIVSTKQEIYKISQGNYSEGKKFIEKREKLSEGKPRSSKIKSIRRHETKKSQPVMKKSQRPKAQTKSITKRSTGKSTNVQKEYKRRR